MRHAINVRHALVGAGALGATVLGLLENAHLGVICLDSRGRIAHSNSRAVDILRGSDRLYDRRGVLCAASPSADATLRRLLAQALPRWGRAVVPTGGSLTIASVRRRPPLAVHVIPLAASLWDFGARSAAVLVLIADPSTPTRIDPARLASTLGLTETESQIAAVLAEGGTVGEIAKARFRAEDSVRWHVKRMYAKLGISRQADLVRMVHSVASLPRFHDGWRETGGREQQGELVKDGLERDGFVKDGFVKDGR